MNSFVHWTCAAVFAGLMASSGQAVSSEHLQSILAGQPLPTELLETAQASAKAATEDSQDFTAAYNQAYRQLAWQLETEGAPSGTKFASVVAKAHAVESLLLKQLQGHQRVVIAGSGLGQGAFRAEQAVAASEQRLAQLAELNRLLAQHKSSDTDEALQLAIDSIRPLLKTAAAQFEPAVLRASALPYERPGLTQRDLPSGDIVAVYDQADPAPPGPEDTQADAHAPLSPVIVDQAASLNYDYARIFDFVRTQIRTEYYAGGAKGAEQTLLTGAGNDVDQASLLIALFRASSLPARYVRGVIEVDPEWIGEPLGLSEPSQIINALGRAGVPAEPVVQGSDIRLQIEHTWVTAYVPFSNYRGTTVDRSGEVWVALAPAYKRHDYRQRVVELDGIELDLLQRVDDYLSLQTDRLPLDALVDEVQAVVATVPGLALEDALSKVLVTSEALTLLPAGLPFSVVRTSWQGARLDAPFQHWMMLSISDPVSGDEVFATSVPIAELAGKRLTLSYLPATPNDEDLARQFGGLSATPPYLLKVLPQLRVDGVAVATGYQAMATGIEHELVITLNGPWGSVDASTRMTTGSLAAIALSAMGATGSTEVPELPAAADRESPAARVLHNLGTLYQQHWNADEDSLSALLDAPLIRPYPAVAIVTTSIAPSVAQGLVVDLDFKGVTIDALLRAAEPVSRSGDSALESAWMQTSALQGSYHESSLFESHWAVPAMSADRGLRRALADGGSVWVVDSSSDPTLISQTGHPTSVQALMEQQVARGFELRLPTQPITDQSWTGSVWSAIEPASGASGYFIAGVYAGGATTEFPALWVLQDLLSLLANPYGSEPNQDPLAATRIRVLPSSNGQVGIAGEELERPLTVLLTDEAGRPVEGAQVIFAVQGGGAGLVDEMGQAVAQVIATSNSLGLAEASVRLAEDTGLNATFGFLNPDDEHPSRLGQNWVGAYVATTGGGIGLDQAIRFYTAPAEAAEVKLTSLSLMGASGSGGIYRYRVMLVDAFDNPVANELIDFSALPPTSSCPGTLQAGRFFHPEQCDYRFMEGPVGCAELTEQTVSTVTGAQMAFVPGDSPGGTQYVISAGSGSALPMTHTLAVNSDYAGCGTGTTLLFQPLTEVNHLGANIAAAKPGGLTAARTTRSYYARPDADGIIQYATLDVPSITQYQALDGGGATGVSYQGNGEHEGPVQVGAVAKRHPVEFTFDVTTDVLDSIGFPHRPGNLPPWQFGASSAYAATVAIENILPATIEIDLDGFSSSALEVQYSIEPVDYVPVVRFDLYEDDQLLRVKYLLDGPGSGPVVFPPGIPFDVSKDYSLQIVLSPDADNEIVSDPFPVDMVQPIVRSIEAAMPIDLSINTDQSGGLVRLGQVERPIRVSADIDLPNDRFCESRDFLMELTQPATVSIDLYKLNSQGDPTGDVETLLDQQSFVAGEHNVEMRATDLGTGTFQMAVTAISDLDGHDEQVGALVHSTFDIQNRLPVGHAMVKGVDLADGGVIVSRSDINIPGRGAGLSFSRTYASNGRNAPGPIGAGWSHNYQSRVVRTACGDMVVIGAEGGTMRFAQDGENFRPLKGYHGTLVRSITEGGFDFYPPGGMRYHFSQQQESSWWLDYIEDTNGNRTTLAYDYRANAPLLRQVTDSSGRSLFFSYEVGNFLTFSGEVLKRIVGPAGIQVDFDYDEWGNLVDAARNPEAGTSDPSWQERYSYNAGSDLNQIHLLRASVDQLNGSSRQVDYNAQTVITTVDANAVSFPAYSVESITEPDGGQTQFSYTLGPWGMSQFSTVTNARGFTTDYTLNDYGAAVAIAAPNGTRSYVWNTSTDVLLESETDEIGRTRSYTYDAHGNLTSETIAGSHTRSVSYWAPDHFDAPYIKNRPRTETNFRGVTTTLDYDERGNQTAQTTGTVTTTAVYNELGDRVSFDDGLGVTTFAYDDHGYERSRTDADGFQWTASWDERGRRLRETDANGNVVQHRYDQRDRRIESTRDMTLSDGGTTVVVTETVAYDDTLRTRTETDRLGRSTTYQHDSMGRVVVVTNALGDQMLTAYDFNGNKTEERDWAGRITTYDYDDADRLRFMYQPLGKTTEYRYDPVGNVLNEIMSSPTDADRETIYDYDPERYFVRSITRVNPDGDQVVMRSYDGEGNIETETDPLGRVMTYSYDEFNRRLTADGPLGSGQRWQYDAVGNVLRETTLNGVDQVRRFAYSPASRLLNQLDATDGLTQFQTDGNGNVTRVIDPRGGTTDTSYNELNLPLTRSIDYSNNFESGTSLTTWEYDRAGNAITETASNGNIRTTTYDALNRPRSQSDSLGPIATWDYDQVGNVTAQTDPAGSRTEHDYNALNQRTETRAPLGRTTRRTYTAYGEVKTATDAMGGVTTHSIDTLGRVTNTTGPESLNLAVTFDAANNVRTRTDSRGTVTTFDYNDLNQRISETVTGTGGPWTRTFTYDLVGNPRTETDRRGIDTKWTYDKENRLTTTTRDDRLLERRGYDFAGNLVSLVDGNGVTTAYEYDERNLQTGQFRPELQITRFGLDAMGDVTTEVRPGNRTITREYDARQRITAETNNAGERTETGYDANGNRTSVRRPKGDNHIWTFAYDAANRLTGVTSPEGHSTTYGYDLNDNRLNQTDANTRTTTFTYDARNRMRSKRYVDGNTFTFDYDANDNMTAMAEPNGTAVSYTYDALNRRTGATYSKNSETVTENYALDGNGNPFQIHQSVNLDHGTFTGQQNYSYDTLDRMRSFQTLYGETLQYSYDLNGNRTELLDHDGRLTRYTYDEVNRLRTVSLPSQPDDIIIDYYPNNRIETLSYPNGATANYSYDAADRVDVIDNTVMGSTVTKHDYDYDLNGNRTQLTEENGQGEEITTYQYDRDDRMTVVAYPDHTASYVLDPVGNRTQEQLTGSQNLTRTYVYNNRDQLTNVSDTTGLNIDYAFDENGNQVSKTEAAATTTFQYTPRNRMATVTLQGAPPIHYGYNPQGLRVNKQTPGAETRYIYDDTALIAETNVLGNTIARYHYSADRKVAYTKSGTTLFYFQDALGTPTAITRADGGINARMTHDVWGQVVRETGTNDQPFSFTGYQRDQETGLLYAQQRYYDDFIGRFLREDPFAGDINTPPSLHRYNYALNNPTVYTDPNGMVAVIESGDVDRLTSAYENGNGITGLGDGVHALLRERGLDHLISTRFVAEDVGRKFSTQHSLDSSGVTTVLEVLGYALRGGSDASAFIVAEAGDKPGDAFKFAKNYVGDTGSVMTDYMLGQLANGLVAGDVADISPEFSAGLAAADRRASQNVTSQLAFMHQIAPAPGVHGVVGDLVLSSLADFQRSVEETDLNPFTPKAPRPLARRANALVVLEAVTAGAPGLLVGKLGIRRGVAAPVAHGTPYRQLSRSRIRLLESKEKARTLSREEWAHLQWQRRLTLRRQEGIDEFWARERQRLTNGEGGTRLWNDEATRSILAGGQPRGIFSHHRYSVARYPHLANDPSTIYPTTFYEHFYKWHGGNWQNPTHGLPLRPELPDSF